MSDERISKVPRKINIPPPMMLGLNGAQAFCWVSAMIIMGMISSTADSILSSVMSWITTAVLLIILLAVLRFINGKRRALLSHTFIRLRSMMKIKRYAGRGTSYAWGGGGHRGGERPY